MTTRGDPRRRVAIVTGTRAEFGLLRPVMHAVRSHPGLDLLVIAAGSHLVSPAESFREVKSEFGVADVVPMQVPGHAGRVDDAEAVGRGIARFARCFNRLHPDWVVVLGDRIEAFAAASAASIGGWALAHIHAGDRAEGIADESMRHAISKLAHLHLAASPQSAERLRRMGEREQGIVLSGSPAIDGLDAIGPASDDAFREVGSPEAVFLLHPVGQPGEVEEAGAQSILQALSGLRVLALHPNLDAGREGILRALDAAGVLSGSAGSPWPSLVVKTHIPRNAFVALLKRLAARPAPGRGFIIGNSSAALIECAALGLPAIDVGPRQGGRERCANVLHRDRPTPDTLAPAIRRARSLQTDPHAHPYGDGHAGERIAAALHANDPHNAGFRTKRCVY